MNIPAVRGIIREVLPVFEKNGFKKQTVVFQPDEPNDQSITIDFIFDKIDELARFKTGSQARISFSIQSKEFSGRWFTNLVATEIQTAGGEKPTQIQEPASFDILPPSRTEYRLIGVLFHARLCLT